MIKIGMIRCEKNEENCPLTGCFTSLAQTKQGFAGYDECSLSGVFTCRCPGSDFTKMAKILKGKGAEVIHVPTCTFARKQDGKWVMGDGFCDRIDDLAVQASAEAQIPIIKGSAHLPEGYDPE